MLLLRTAIFCTSLALAGCAAAPLEQTAAARPPAPAAPVLRGTILAMRAVPAVAMGPARLLVSDLGAPPATAGAHLVEFIVRTSSGATIAVVQPDRDGLQPGESVGVLPGAPARIDPLPRS